MSQQNTVDANQAGQPGEQEEPVLTGVLADQSDVLLDENGDGHVGQRDAEEWEERESRNQLKQVSGSCRTSPKSNTARSALSVWCWWACGPA